MGGGASLLSVSSTRQQLKGVDIMASIITTHTGPGSLSDLMDFDHVITVHADGSVTDGPEGMYAPECFVDADQDGQVTEEPECPGWELLSGYTGQYGYRGPVMHSSEYIGGRLARDILATPGVYVSVVVEVLEPEDGEGDVEPAGWAVARLDA